jgi:[acyl-carrier-protein] S-malonyltransferase
MKRVAFLFPGVGSQYVGMGKTLFDTFDVYRKTFEEAGDTLKMDIAGLCSSPDRKTELNRLENAQVVLVTASIACYRVFMQEFGISPHFCMGHSLGEYSALCAAGVIGFPDALNLVKQRGLIVKEVSAGIQGTMMWVINLDTGIVDSVCREASSPGEEVYVSAFDSPPQSSISGHTSALMRVARELEKKGAIVYPLQLSGPFHCPLMKDAADRMASVLGQYTYKDPQCVVLANHNALPYNGASSVIDHLSLQLVSPIRWMDSIGYLIEQGVENAFEMGPKNVLKFLVQKITPSIRVYTTDNERDFASIGNDFVLKEEEYKEVVGECLGAAVSTKNNRSDMDEKEYDEKVVKPYRKIEEYYNAFTSNDLIPRQEHVAEAFGMLHEIFAAKDVSLHVRDKHLNDIFGKKIFSFYEIYNKNE